MSEALPATVRVSLDTRARLWQLKFQQQQQTSDTVSMDAVIRQLLDDREAAK